jgi:hypothetical protein
VHPKYFPRVRYCNGIAGYPWITLPKTSAEVILPAERDHAPLTREAVKFEFLKGQPVDFANERVLLLFIQNVRMIPEFFRQLE